MNGRFLCFLFLITLAGSLHPAGLGVSPEAGRGGLWSEAMSGAPGVTLNEMEMMCRSGSWVDVNDFMVNKGWVFYNSSDQHDNRSKKIIWSLDYNRYRDAAKGWFYLFVDAKDETRLAATELYVFDERVYNKFISDINAKGYKRVSSDIKEGYSSIIYKNSSYIISISISQTIRSWDDEKITAYDILVVKAGSFMDPDNGTKRYTYNNGVYLEYNLKNGVTDGPAKLFYEDGQLKASMTYTGNRLTGDVKCYDTEGRVECEFTVLDTNLNCRFVAYQYDEDDVPTTKMEGTAKCYNFFYESALYFAADSKYKIYIYRQGRLTEIKDLFGNNVYGGGDIYDAKSRLLVTYTSKHDTLVGRYRRLYYNDEDSLYMEFICNFSPEGKKVGKASTYRYFRGRLYEESEDLYADDKQDGRQQSFYIKEGQRYQFEDYFMRNGTKTGKYRNVIKDSVYVGYRDDDGKRNGMWCKFEDRLHAQDSTVRSIDTAQMFLVERGYYLYEQRHGNWYYSKWKNDCHGCRVVGYTYSHDKWNSAIIEHGDLRYEYEYAENTSVVKREYLNGVRKCLTTYFASGDVMAGLDRGDIAYFDNLIQKNGLCEVYDSAGRVIESGSYRNSVKTGGWAYYYYDQNCQILRSETYSNEHFVTIDTKEPFSGKLTIVDGNRIYEISIKKGLRHGTTKIFEKGNPKAVAKEKYKDGLLVE